MSGMKMPINAGSALASQIGATSAEMGKTAMSVANAMGEGFQRAYNSIAQWQKDHDDRNKFKKEMEIKNVELENATEALKQRKDIFNKTYVDKINYGTDENPKWLTAFEAQQVGQYNLQDSQRRVNDANAFLSNAQGSLLQNEHNTLNKQLGGKDLEKNDELNPKNPKKEINPLFFALSFLGRR